MHAWWRRQMDAFPSYWPFYYADKNLDVIFLNKIARILNESLLDYVNEYRIDTKLSLIQMATCTEKVTDHIWNNVDDTILHNQVSTC